MSAFEADVEAREADASVYRMLMKESEIGSDTLETDLLRYEQDNSCADDWTGAAKLLAEANEDVVGERQHHVMLSVLVALLKAGQTDAMKRKIDVCVESIRKAVAQKCHSLKNQTSLSFSCVAHHITARLPSSHVKLLRRLALVLVRQRPNCSGCNLPLHHLYMAVYDAKIQYAGLPEPV